MGYCDAPAEFHCRFINSGGFEYYVPFLQSQQFIHPLHKFGPPICVRTIVCNRANNNCVEPFFYRYRGSHCYQKLIAKGPPLGNRCNPRRCGSGHVAGTED